MISPNPESLLCHCLRITVGQVQNAITANRQSTLRDVMRNTGAGRACMSCHARIRAMLAGRSPVSTFVIPACPGCANPACGCSSSRSVAAGRCGSAACASAGCGPVEYLAAERPAADSPSLSEAVQFGAVSCESVAGSNVVAGLVAELAIGRDG